MRRLIGLVLAAMVLGPLFPLASANADVRIPAKVIRYESVVGNKQTLRVLPNDMITIVDELGCKPLGDDQIGVLAKLNGVHKSKFKCAYKGQIESWEHEGSARYANGTLTVSSVWRDGKGTYRNSVVLKLDGKRCSGVIKIKTGDVRLSKCVVQ